MRAALLEDVDLDRHAAGQSMCCACQANIIWPVGHLDHVDKSFVDDAVVDEALRGPSYRYVNRTLVDEVSIGDDALVVGLVLMNKCAAIASMMPTPSLGLPSLIMWLPTEGSLSTR